MALHQKPPHRGRHLKRLNAGRYTMFAQVHWIMTIDKRHRGWLDDLIHSQVREALLHTCHRYQLLCPVYCLMPDHAHFLWCGISKKSDQLKASQFFRRCWNEALQPKNSKLQKQAYDHLLTESERYKEAFEDTCVYIMKNPERGKLVEDWKAWPHSGSVCPGCPRLHPTESNFWEKYWTIHNTVSEHPGV